MKMRYLIAFLLGCLALPLQADVLDYRDQRLQLHDSARACYLAWIKLYDAHYFRSADGSTRCVRLDYLRGFSREQLIEATEQILQQRHGAAWLKQHGEAMRDLRQAYRPVGVGDSYQFCIDAAQGGEMLRDGQSVVRFEQPQFADRFMAIWVDEVEQGEHRWRVPGCIGGRS